MSSETPQDDESVAEHAELASARPSRRRTSAVAGCVNFPIGDPAWGCTGEGGMYVVLTVWDALSLGNYAEKWVPCCGGYHHDSLDDAAIGCDTCKPKPEHLELARAAKALSKDANTWSKEDLDLFLAAQQLPGTVESNHFPGYHHEILMSANTAECARCRVQNGCTSVPMLATLTIGATGSSLFSEELGRYWQCTYESLNEDGKTLYNSLKRIYGSGCQLHIVTCLDT